jgi:hypothetical protein
VTVFLVSLVLVVGAVAVAEGYLIMGQNQWLKNDAQKLRADVDVTLEAIRRLLMETPTPDETEMPEPVEPVVRFPGLRASENERPGASDVHSVADIESARQDEPITQPIIMPPSTTPMERAWEESAAELAADDWQGHFEAEMAAARARMDELAKGAA